MNNLVIAVWSRAVKNTQPSASFRCCDAKRGIKGERVASDRRRCLLSRDVLEIQQFLPEDQPKVSVAKAVSVTKRKEQREC